ncbi:MAG TPA: AAA family ATPase, partial [Nitrososphaera sp.]|nr:AAA family ATPase [Nitrososphaera sp.]
SHVVSVTCYGLSTRGRTNFAFGTLVWYDWVAVPRVRFGTGVDTGSLLYQWVYQKENFGMVSNSKLEAILRPTRLDDVIGHGSVVRILQEMLKTIKYKPLLFSGPSGIGKTTLARIVGAGIHPTPKFGEGVREHNAIGLKFSDVREILGSLQGQVGLRTIVIDEADNLSDASQKLFLTEMNKVPCQHVYIFCTAYPEKLITPLRSRFVEIKLKPLNADEQAAMVRLGWGMIVSDKEPDEFIIAVQKHRLGIPRNILNAVENYTSGLYSMDEAIKNQLPEEDRHAAKDSLSPQERAQQRAQLVAGLLKAKPDMSVRAIEKATGLSHGVAQRTKEDAEKLLGTN